MLPSEYTNEDKSTPMLYNGIESQIKFLQGKVLTVIDASMPSGEQKKAIKDLINQKFSEQLNHIYNITRFNEKIHSEFGSGVIVESFSGQKSPIKNEAS